MKELLSPNQHEDFFSEAPSGVMLRNGFLAIKKGGFKLEPPSAEHRALFAVPTDYSPSVPPGAWARYLGQLFDCDEDGEQKKAVLQEFLGACLCGIATNFQKCLYLTGDGSNGKSGFIKAVTAIFPQSVLTTVSPEHFHEPYYRAALQHSRLNTVSELEKTAMLESEAFKAIVSGDAIMARQPYQPPFSFCPRAGHLLGMNDLPVNSDTSRGFWRRVLVVQFNAVFDQGNLRTPEQIDAELVGATSEILAWACAGAERLVLQGGYTTPGSSVTALDEWRDISDTVLSWVNDYTDKIEPENGVPAQQAYAVYAKTTLAQGQKPCSFKLFCKRLRRIVGKPAHCRDGNRFPFCIKHTETQKQA